METEGQTMSSTPRREPWNKGKLIGQKPPLRPKHVWSLVLNRASQERIRIIDNLALL